MPAVDQGTLVCIDLSRAQYLPPPGLTDDVQGDRYGADWTAGTVEEVKGDDTYVVLIDVQFEEDFGPPRFLAAADALRVRTAGQEC